MKKARKLKARACPGRSQRAPVCFRLGRKVFEPVIGFISNQGYTCWSACPQGRAHWLAYALAQIFFTFLVFCLRFGARNRTEAESAFACPTHPLPGLLYALVDLARSSSRRLKRARQFAQAGWEAGRQAGRPAGRQAGRTQARTHAHSPARSHARTHARRRRAKQRGNAADLLHICSVLGLPPTRAPMAAQAAMMHQRRWTRRRREGSVAATASWKAKPRHSWVRAWPAHAGRVPTTCEPNQPQDKMPQHCSKSLVGGTEEIATLRVVSRTCREGPSFSFAGRPPQHLCKGCCAGRVEVAEKARSLIERAAHKPMSAPALNTWIKVYPTVGQTALTKGFFARSQRSTKEFGAKERVRGRWQFQ